MVVVVVAQHEMLVAQNRDTHTHTVRDHVCRVQFLVLLCVLKDKQLRYLMANPPPCRDI